MFQKYIIRNVENVDTCFNDCDDIWVLCRRKNAYIIVDAFGNKMKLQQRGNHPAILTAYKSSDPRFVIYFFAKKIKAEIMPVEIYRLLSEDDRIKACKNYKMALDFNYVKVTNAFIKKYEDLVYNSPDFEGCYDLVNALIKINQSVKQEKDRMKVPAVLELKRLIMAPN
jgi:hypothetical protein